MLTTELDYIALFRKYGIFDVRISTTRPGSVVLQIYRNRFRAWWYRKKINKEIESGRPIGINVYSVIVKVL